MKGIIFTEFLGLVEQKWDEDMVDDIIEACDLPSGGAYTAVGTYDHREIVALVSELSERSGVAVPDLLQVYGKHLFGKLAASYPEFVNKASSLLTFLEGVESYIHVEVRKLYPDAELPSFETRRPDPGVLEMIYRSSRHLDDVCHGLIEGSIAHFKTEASIEREPLDDGTMFVIRCQ
ncbi:heme NO-binding domain-containing protein [Haloferula rosea]|uniref:Heme NO-binding domain-containing protein n=1 Tax=Haloferula rosea TaxID=490093 RepID=A0A934VGL6_9BACT|nr:heme NO-binding domain-containing protein [Haloferula rosea]MBK1828167.1 heme NO-binding domain-containing protein [Haloferula rosea]